jgi:rhodanese-related sulfurtransferase
MLDRLLNRSSAGVGAIDQALEVDVRQTAQARVTGGAQIVDVREPDEWREGHIPGAIHIPLGKLAVRAGALDPARPVITVCRSGNRSLVALAVLRDAGITAAKSLAGGMNAWRSAGQPVER